MRSELHKYLRPDGHVTKLKRKVEDAAASPDVVAARLGHAGDVIGFVVRGVFVTRELTPAAFVDGVDHEFVTIDRLPRVPARR